MPPYLKFESLSFKLTISMRLTMTGSKVAASFTFPLQAMFGHSNIYYHLISELLHYQEREYDQDPNEYKTQATTVITLP